jgi:hypothetical protein
MPDEPQIAGAPPVEKRSFAPTEDEMKKAEAAKKAKEEGKPEREIPPPEVTLFLIYGKLDAILTEQKIMNNMFQKAGAQNTTTVTPAPVTQAPAPAAAPAPTKPTEQTPRMKEILAALEPYEDLINIDTTSSNLSVILKPKQFLGSDHFSKIAATVRTIGGQYVSAGKNSHFEVPKAPTKKA